MEQNKDDLAIRTQRLINDLDRVQDSDVSEDTNNFIGNVKRGLELFRAGYIIADTADSIISHFRKKDELAEP